MKKSQLITSGQIKGTTGHPAKLARGMASMLLVLLFGAGCSTMKEPTLTTNSADSYAQHQEKNGLVIGVQPMTDKQQVTDIFKINLLDKGVLPVLVVARNTGQSASFIIAKDKIMLFDEATGAGNASQRKQVTSNAGQGMANAGGVMVALGGFALPLAIIGMPLEFTGMQKASNASVIEFNLADKEYYSHTLGPGDTAQGFVYFPFKKNSPPAGNYRFTVGAKNPGSGAESDFEFPFNVTNPK